jgi:diguanylate cyclase (GGDEF)-like protein
MDIAVLHLRRGRGLRLLDKAVDGVLQETPLGDALAHVVDLVEHDVPPSSVTIGWGWDGETFAGSSAGPDAPSIEALGSLPDADRSPWALALRDDAPIESPDLEDVPEGLRTELAGRGIEACWAFPVPVAPGTRPTAVVVVWRHVRGPARVQLETSINRATRLVGLALDYRRARERWQHEARTDGLTGLANRAALADHLATLMSEPSGFEPIAVLYCDLDEFKPVNDRYSHTVGDVVLTLVAKRVRDSVRPSDFVARLGGDEIAVVCQPAPDRPAAVDIADRVITAVNAPFRVDGHAISVGVSVGIAHAESRTHAASLLRDADRALLAAKAAGKNRWAFAS